MSGNFNLEGKKRQEKSSYNHPNIDGFKSDEKFEKRLKSLSDTRAFDQNVFNEGMTYFESGLTIDDMDETHKNNLNFMRGYKHAERLAMVKEMEQKRKSK